MINYPKNWHRIGRKVLAKDIEESLRITIKTLGVRNLSLSGGIDSTLLLYFMKKVLGDPIHCHTIALDVDHPDFTHAKLATEFFNVSFHPHFLAEEKEGDKIVKCFYEFLKGVGVEKIIAGDGVDEFNCGYYAHLHDPSEKTYYDFIWRLQKEQLEPLNENSGDIEVFLPYMDEKLISLFSQIPIFEKVDDVNRKRVLIQLAKGKLPDEIIYRRKFGFCDAATRKDLQ